MAARAPMTAADFQMATAISIDRMERFHRYLEILTRWQHRINLVGAETLKDPWRRHFFDSAQLAAYLPGGNPVVVDLGSGAGFPGMVLALLGWAKVHLVEANARKCAFLREVDRLTGAGATIHHGRAESIPPFQADVVTARGFAPLPELLSYAAVFQKSSTEYLFLKGRTVDRELTDSAKTWMMQTTQYPSRTEQGGIVLKLERIARRHEHR